MYEEKRMKNSYTITKVLILIPAFLFVISFIFFQIARFFGNSFFIKPSTICAYGMILHVFPGIILSIVGLIKTKGKCYMGMYRFLACLQIIIDIAALIFFKYITMHAS